MPRDETMHDPAFSRVGDLAEEWVKSAVDRGEVLVAIRRSCQQSKRIDSARQ
jgi:hypothetical protein